MAEFTLNREELTNQIRATEQKIALGLDDRDDTPLIELEILVVDHSNEPRLHDASRAEQLAWFVYFLSTSGCWSGPPDFGAKGILGHASSGPIADGCLMLQVCVDGAEPVLGGPLDPDDLMADPPNTQREADHQMARSAEKILAESSRLIPAARAAAQMGQAR